MKAKLQRDCKPFGRTGETVEVSPDHFEWLTSLGIAVPVTEAGEQAEKPEQAEEKADRKTAEKPAAKSPAKKTAAKKK